MNTTALDNDKLKTVVTETTEIISEERDLKIYFDKLTQLLFFPHMLHIFLIIATAKMLTRLTKRLLPFYLESYKLPYAVGRTHLNKPLPLNVTPSACENILTILSCLNILSRRSIKLKRCSILIKDCIYCGVIQYLSSFLS